MSKFKSKLARRIIAFILSGAMVMSNMSVLGTGTAYAAESTLETEVATEIESVENEEPDDAAANKNDAVSADDIDNDSGGEKTETSEDNKEEPVEQTPMVEKPTLTIDEVKDAEDSNKLTAFKLKWNASKVMVGTEDKTSDYTITYDVKATYVENSETKTLSLDNAAEIEAKEYEITVDKLTSGTEYTFSVTANATETSPADGSEAKKASAESDTQKKTYTEETGGGQETLNAPTNLEAKLNEAKDGVVVSWDAVTGADSYEVTAKGQEGAADVSKTDITTTTVTFGLTDSSDSNTDSLIRGKSYKFSVIAKKNGGTESAAAETENALTIPTNSENEPSGEKTKTYVLTGADVGLVAKESAATGRIDRVGTDGYFKINYTGSSQVDNNGNNREWKKTYSDTATKTAGAGEDYILKKSSDSNNPTEFRIRMNKYTSDKAPAIGFTTANEADSVEVRVWWAGGKVGRIVKLADETGTIISDLTYTTATVEEGLLYNTWTLEGEKAKGKTYYIVNDVGDNILFKAEVIETSSEVKERTAWTQGTDPKIAMTKKTGEDGTESTDTMTVTVSDFSLSDAGADKLVVEILKDGEVVKEEIVRTQDAEGANSHAPYSFDYQATESGSYTAKATLTRRVAGAYDETNHTATNMDDTDNAKIVTSDPVTIDLALTAPENFTAAQVNKKYDVKLSWDIVNGGEGYEITVSEKDATDILATYAIDDKSTLTYTATGYGTNNETPFAAGKTYTFTIKSTKGENKSEDGATADVTIAEVVEGSVEIYTLDMAELTTLSGAENGVGSGEYFKILSGGNTNLALEKVTPDTTLYPEKGIPIFEDKYEGTQRLKFGGKAQKEGRVIEFTTSAKASVTVWWINVSESNRQMHVYNSIDFKTSVADTNVTFVQNAAQKTTLELNDAGTYYLGSTDGDLHIYKVVVEQEAGGTPIEPEDPTDWEEVVDPTITAEYDDASRTGKIEVAVNAEISDANTEKVTVHMYDMSGKEVGKAKEDKKKGNEHKFTFEPTYSSTYSFDAVLSRTIKGEDNKETVLEKKSIKTESIIFTLPLATPKIIDYVNLGEVEGSDPKSGSVELAWGTVDEATGYVVTATDENGNEVFNSGVLTSTTITIEKGLEIGKTYTFGVAALRDYTGANDGTEESAKGTLDLKINEKADSFEQGKYILDPGVLYDASQEKRPNVILKAGRYSADQGAADVQPKTYQKINGKNVDGDGNEVSNTELDAAVTATLDILKSFEETTYFTVMFGSDGKLDAGDKRKIYPNNFVSSNKIELGSKGITAGTVPTSDAIKFKTSATSRVDIYWRTNTAGNGVQIVDAKGNQIGSKTGDSTNDLTNVGLVMTSFIINDPGTYYIGQVKGKVRITRVVVYDGYEKKARPEWTTEDVEGGKPHVTAPVITSAVQEDGKIIVKATADIGSEASADSVTVYMTYKDENGEEQGADIFFQTSTSEGDEHKFEFTPEASNTYYFTAKMAREGEETTIDSVDKDAEGNDIRKSVAFKLPLGNAAIKSITNKGTLEGNANYGKVEAVWSPVAEAVYKVVIEDSTGAVIYEKIEKANLITIGEKETENSGWKEGIEGLALNTEYTFKVTAVREKAPDAEGNAPVYGEDAEWSATASEKFTITGKDSQTWNYANFGSRANRSLMKETDKNVAGILEDSLIDTDPDSSTKGQQLANVKINKEMKRNDCNVLKTDDNDNPTKVRVWSLGTYGKIVPNSTDGVSFYYTTVDPSTYNFTLSADVHVDQWTLSNGQEGFGVAAFDQVGKSPDDSMDGDYEGGDVWNNSYMAIVTKTEYKWDDENKQVANSGSAVSLKLGVESIERTGVTADNIAEFKNTATVADATSKYFKTNSKPLDTQMHDKSYDNLIGNMTNPGDAATIDTPITDLRMEIALNDTGYYVSYTPITVDPVTREVLSEGTKVTNKHWGRDALSQIDKDSVYAGFFAARNAMVTFSNIQFTTTPYDAANAKPEEKEVEYVKSNFSIVSATTSNSADYLLTYDANWHGKLYVKDENGADISDKAVDLKTRKQDASGNYYIQVDGTPEETDKAEIKVTLNSGNNTFQTTFEPDEEYDPYNGDPITRLENYETKNDLLTVTYKKYGQEGQALYVAPLGKATGDGTKKNPLDIYTAVKYVQPGQTIYLMGEKYDLSKTIRIERGTDGTNDKMIHMVPDPDEGKRPVLDFHGACEGMVIAGDYWYFYGFDVTRSADRQDGIRVCGDYNTLDSINTYKNGNTGIQISRLLGSDTNINTDWPKYNTIKNCNSYLNADPGYEDADGFACKLTSGVGNKFIGCVAAYNADDGWDLFAKVETGKIGMVTIENCITYKNGYVLRANGGTGDLAWFGEAENVTEVTAGNGNGFKMGGSSLSGYHTLRNSLAFYNKAKGFDSNSCPDIQVYNSITFNNEGYNIAFYTKGSTTDFAARGIVSYRTGENLRNKDLEDRIGELTGEAPNKVSNITTTQQKGMNKIFNNTNYFFNRYSGVSENATDFVQHYTTRGVETDLTCEHDGIVKNDWFVSVDFDGENGWFTNLKNESIADGTPHVVDRNANGTIKMGGFLQLTDKANAAGSGLPDLSESTADDVVSKKPEDFDGVTETDGTIEKGDADDESSDNVDSDDLNKKPGSAKDQVGLWFSIVNEDEIGYTGKALKPEIRVYYDNTLLTKKDYTVTYKNTVNAWLGDTKTGTGKTIDTATGKEPVQKDKVNPETGEIEKDANGNPIKEEVIEGAKYSYGSDAKSVPTIIVKGKGNYIGQAENVYFEIQPVNLANDAQNRVSAPAITVLKANQALKPAITFAGKKLSEKKDYDAASEPTTDEVTKKQSLKVTGKGNFVGQVAVEVRTVPSDCDPDNLVKNFKIGKIAPQYRKGYKTDYTGKIEEYLQVRPLDTLTEKMITTKSGTEVKLYNPETNPDGVTISYVNNVEIGTATAVITGTGKYYGTKEIKFQIIAPPLATLMKDGNLKFIDTTKLAELIKADTNAAYDKTTQKITVADINTIAFDFPTKEKPYAYMGKAVQWDNLAVAAQIGDAWYKLTANTDYVLTYSGNNKVGSASVTVKGKGNYSGNLKQPFVIEAFDISNAEKLKYLGGTFALNEDATAKYFEEDRTPTEDNANTVTPSTPKADAKSKNTINYGRMTTALYYDKAGAKPTISLRINGNLMRAGKDYTITYKNNAKVTPANADEKQLASFTIKGKGGLTGTITGTYRIEKRPFNDPTNRLQVTATDVKLTSKDKNNANGFTGKNNTKIVVKDAKGKTLSLNKDYVIDKYEYVDNSSYKVLSEKNAAEPITDNKSDVRISDKNTYYTVKVTVKGAGENYTEDTLSAYYRIAYGKNSIKSAKAEIIYDGDPKNNPGLANKYFYYKEGSTVTLSGADDEKTLKVTFKDGNEEKELKWGTDFKVVSYSKNDRKGTAKLIIEGQGEYIDQKVISFKIGAQDFFWWTQPETKPDQPEDTVTPQDLLYIMSEGLDLAMAR